VAQPPEAPQTQFAMSWKNVVLPPAQSVWQQLTQSCPWLVVMAWHEEMLLEFNVHEPPLLDPDELPLLDPLLDPEELPLLEPLLDPLLEPDELPLLDPEELPLLEPLLDPLLEPDELPLLEPLEPPLLDPVPPSLPGVPDEPPVPASLPGM
jgi:hypothetical protein